MISYHYQGENIMNNKYEIVGGIMGVVMHYLFKKAITHWKITSGIIIALVLLNLIL